MTAARTLVLAGLLSACHSEYNLEPIDKDPDPTAEDCPGLCDLALEAAASLEDEGCVVLCDIGVAPDWYGQVDVLLFNLANIWAEVDHDGGGTCDLMIQCGGQGVCMAMFDLLMNDTGGDVAAAAQAFLDCLLQEDPTCDDELSGCTGDHDQVYDDCMADSNDVEYCSCVAQEHDNVCYCQYDACHTGGDGLDCHPADCEDPPPPIPLPVSTGPGRFAVSRRLIDAQMARMDALALETGVWPVRDRATGAWKGVRLFRVEPGHPLYRMGLRGGDLLLRANDIPVMRAYTAPADLLPLRSASEIRIALQRDGQVRQLVYAIAP